MVGEIGADQLQPPVERKVRRGDQPGQEPYTDADSHRDAHAFPDSDANRDAHAYTNANGVPYAERDGYGLADANRVTIADANSDGDSLPDAYAEQVKAGIHRDSLAQAREKVQELLCETASPGSPC